MRLSQQIQGVINETAHTVFGDEITVKIFGSRLDDRAFGGDIDILIQSEAVVSQSRRKSLQLVAKLQLKIGDQPIDVLVVDAQTNHQPIHREALLTAVAI